MGRAAPQAEGEAKKSTGVGPGENLENQSHQVFYKHKVLSGYYFNPSMEHTFLLSYLHHIHFNLAFACIRMLEEDTRDFLSLKLSLKMTALSVTHGLS